MDPEEKTKSPKQNFGKVIDILHNKSKLSSLRTYQGDMAQFIKEKNESVFSIAEKEKEKKRQEEKSEIEFEKKVEKITEKGGAILKPEKIKEKILSKKSSDKNIKTNIVVAFISLVLVSLGVFASLYVFKFLKADPVVNVVIETEIIPYNNSITLSGATSENLKEKFGDLSPVGGVSIVKISGADGLPLKKTADLFNFLKISPPATLIRTIGEKYMVGIISLNKEFSPFIAIYVNDFGNAFSAMLDWEKDMNDELSFLNPDKKIATATTTATTATIFKQGPFVWKDLIVKNKDARGSVNQKNQVNLIYTFLNKNIILITNSTEAMAEISSIYASRDVVR